MNHPIIGISGSHNVADRQMFVRENYMQSVLRAGGIPVLLPEIEYEETAKAILDQLDGLLLAGGGDVLPSRYGEETLPACGEDDPQRDIFELLIIPMAIARNMPIGRHATSVIGSMASEQSTSTSSGSPSSA